MLHFIYLHLIHLCCKLSVILISPVIPLLIVASGYEFHYVLQCPSLHDDRRRLLDSTYLTRVNVLKFANLFQSRNKIKLRHLCKFFKIIFSKTPPPG
jgi:hypothetical protein